MATLGRWTGGAQTQGNLPETWTAPNGLFPTEARNDSSAYSFASATSTLTLPSSGLADGYLVVFYFQYEDTSNGRFNPQMRAIQASGTGTFVSSSTGGYNRDTSEDRSYVRGFAFVDGPSASSTIQIQWKADTDDSTGGTVESCLDVIPLYYSDVAVYSSTDSSLYGGTTPNQVTGWSGTDGASITLASNTVSLTGDNKRYLAFGSQFYEGRGGRTQRWFGFREDGTKDDESKAVAYYRSTSVDEVGGFYSNIYETSTATVTLDHFCYRGDGVAAGQGGADIDGSTPSVGSHSWVVLELNDSAEVFKSGDSVGSQNISVTGPVDINAARDVAVNDSASFTKASDTAIDAAVAMDALAGANVSVAQETVGVTSRWTAYSRFTVNGTEDDNTRHGNYLRNNQGSLDTFGWSANLLSFVSLSAGDDLGLSVQELAGGEDGGDPEIQPGWLGFWGVNLDTLQSTGSPVAVEVPLGTYAYTGVVPNVSASANVGLEIPAGGYSFAGTAPTVLASISVEPPAGAYAYGGVAPVVSAPSAVEVPSGAYTYGGVAPTVSATASGAVQVPTGTYAYSGVAPVVTAQLSISVEVPAGSYQFTGQTPLVFASASLSIPAGAYAFSGEAPLVSAGADVSISVPAGGYGFIGRAPLIGAGEKKVAGSFPIINDDREEEEIRILTQIAIRLRQ